MSKSHLQEQFDIVLDLAHDMNVIDSGKPHVSAAMIEKRTEALDKVQKIADLLDEKMVALLTRIAKKDPDTTVKVTETKIMVIYETAFKSISLDVITWSCVIGAMGMGVHWHSNALQWIAGLLFIALAVTHFSGKRNESTYTPQQAADWLYEKFGATAEMQGNAMKICERQQRGLNHAMHYFDSPESFSNEEFKAVAESVYLAGTGEAKNYGGKVPYFERFERALNALTKTTNALGVIVKDEKIAGWIATNDQMAFDQATAAYLTGAQIVSEERRD